MDGLKDVEQLGIMDEVKRRGAITQDNLDLHIGDYCISPYFPSQLHLDH
jgi:hypothetical protein